MIRLRNGRIASAVVLMAMAMTLFACAPQSSTGTEEAGDSQAETFVWTEDSDCSVCHSVEASTADGLACKDSSGCELSCLTCHTDVDGIAAAHDKVTLADTDGARKLKKTEADASACQGCHGGLEEVAARTVESTALVDKNGTVVNLHALPKSESHDDLTCTSCHNPHSDDPLSQAAYEKCTNCHHAEVFECNTCHS